MYPNGVNSEKRIIYTKKDLGTFDTGLLFAFDGAVQAYQGTSFGATNAAWTYLFSFKKYFELDWVIAETSEKWIAY